MPPDAVLRAQFFDAALRPAAGAAEKALPAGESALFFVDDAGHPYVGYPAVAGTPVYRRPPRTYYDRTGDVAADRLFYQDKVFEVGKPIGDPKLFCDVVAALVRARRRRGLHAEIAAAAGAPPTVRARPVLARGAWPPEACIAFLENRAAERLKRDQGKARAAMAAFKDGRSAEGTTMHAYGSVPRPPAPPPRGGGP